MSYRNFGGRIGLLGGQVARTVRAKFREALLGSAVAAATLPAAAMAQPAAPQPQRMNVLFIMADDLRVGSAFDSGEVRTPNLDRLAAAGVSFTEAQTQFPLCGPSRASLLSGLRPNTVRVYDLATSVRGNVPDVVTLPQHFRQNGYFSASVGKMYHQGVPGTIGLPPEKDPHDDRLSWDVAFKPLGEDKVAEWDGKLVNPANAHPGIAMAWYADPSGKPHTDELIATKTIELIRENRDKPFFIAAGFYRPHVPVVAPKPYFDLYPAIGWTPESKADTSGVTRTSRPNSLTPEQQREFVRGYYASTSYMDAQVGRILDGLTEAGVADKTIVVFTSDHGFNLGEHGHWQKSSLWRDSTRVPLIIYSPKAKGNGKAASPPVELLDIYPTLSDLAGLPPPVGTEGRSLQPLIDDPGARWDHPALSQVGAGRSVRFGSWRYSEWGRDGANGAELYDLTSDPGEYRNLAALPEHAATVAKLKAMLPGEAPPSTATKLPGEMEFYADVPGGRQRWPR